MKTILFFTLLLANISFGQTNIIANRSHSNNIATLINDTDDFGAIYIPPTDSVILHNSTTLITVKSHWDGTIKRDTVWNHFGLPQTKREFNNFKLNYQKTTIFKGFDKLSNENTRINHFHRNKIQLLFGMLIASTLFFSIIPEIKKR